MNVGQALLAALGAGPAGGGLSAGAVDGASPETALAFAGALANLGAAAPNGLNAGSALPGQPAPTPLPGLGQGLEAAAGIPALLPSKGLQDAPADGQSAAQQPTPAELLAASLLSLLPADVNLGGPQTTAAPATETSTDASADTATAGELQTQGALAGALAMSGQTLMAQFVPAQAARPDAQAALAASVAPQAALASGTPGLPAQRTGSQVGAPRTAAVPAFAVAAAPANAAALGPGPAGGVVEPSALTSSNGDAAPTARTTGPQPDSTAPQQGIPLPAGMAPLIPQQNSGERSSRRADLKVDAPAPANVVAAPTPSVAPAASNDIQPAAPVHQPPNVAPQVSAQLSGHIGRLQNLGDGTHRMIIRIDPEALGPVRVVADIRAGSLQVHLHATTQAGQAALAASLAEVRTDLTRIAPTASLDLGQGQFSQPQGGQNPQQSADLTFGGDLSDGRGGAHPDGRGTPDGQDVVPTHTDQGSPARGTRAAQGASNDHAVDVTA